MKNFIHPTAILTNVKFEGDGNYIGPYCIINNAIIGNNNRFESHCSIGALNDNNYAYISNFCTIGPLVAIHQSSFLGEGCVIGMGAVVPKNKRILPYKAYVGVPCKELKDNSTLMDKKSIDQKDLAELRKAYNTEFNNKVFK